MNRTAFTRHARSLGRSRWSVARLSGVAAVAALATVAATAQAASGPAASAASSICSRVSPAAVSSIVGYTVPSPTFDSIHIKASKTNFEVSGTEMSCTYGAETSLAALKKTVILDIGVNSRALTATEIKTSIAKVRSEVGQSTFKFSSYSGLGVPAYYLRESEGGTSAEVIAAIVGSKTFGASAFTTSLPASKLAALAKLAAKL